MYKRDLYIGRKVRLVGSLWMPSWKDQVAQIVSLSPIGPDHFEIKLLDGRTTRIRYGDLYDEAELIDEQPLPLPG